MTEDKDRTAIPGALPSPIQLTPDQLTEVGGGGTLADIVIRKGIPWVTDLAGLGVAQVAGQVGQQLAV